MTNETNMPTPPAQPPALPLQVLDYSPPPRRSSMGWKLGIAAGLLGLLLFLLLGLFKVRRTVAPSAMVATRVPAVRVTPSPARMQPATGGFVLEIQAYDAAKLQSSLEILVFPGRQFLARSSEAGKVTEISGTVQPTGSGDYRVSLNFDISQQDAALNSVQSLSTTLVLPLDTRKPLSSNSSAAGATTRYIMLKSPGNAR